jgi:hypothetical protein
MASYEPPTAVYPIFDSLVFQAPNSASLTIAEADQRYLARQNVATSIASTTAFSGDVSVGSSLLEYTSGTGLMIKTTANSEKIEMDVLDAGGVAKQKIELNSGHLHLYDAVRFTESATPANYSRLQQTGAVFDIVNHPNSSTINLKTHTSGGATVTPLSLSSTAVTANLPITIGYTVSADTQLGYSFTRNGSGTAALTNNTILTVVSASSVTLGAGTYIINLCGNNTISAAGGTLTSYEIGISTQTNAFQNGFNEFVLAPATIPLVAGRIVGRLTRVFTVASSTTFFFVHRMVYSGFAVTQQGADSYFQYIRIA